jgi:hypothetical protein
MLRGVIGSGLDVGLLPGERPRGVMDDEPVGSSETWWSQLLGLAVLCAVLYAGMAAWDALFGDPPSPPEPATAVQEGPEPPPAQDTFCDIVTAASARARGLAPGAGGELAAVRAWRRDQLAYLDRDYAWGWEGMVDVLRWTSDGELELVVRLPCGARLRAWSDGRTDAGHPPLALNPALRERLAQLRLGWKVRVDGDFVRDEADFVRSSWRDERRSLLEPDFLLQVTDVNDPEGE